MQINLPKASVGLGTSGIGDNFARARLLMAQKAGYVQSTPSPYSQPGTALKQYQSAAPMLNAVAKAQGQRGIPGLLRDGQLGRPPMQGVPQKGGPSLVNTPAPTFQSTVAGRAVGNPFQQLGQPQMPLNWFNNTVNAEGGGQQPPHVEPENIAAHPQNGGSVMPGNGGYVPPGVFRPGGSPTPPGDSPGWLQKPGQPSPGGIVGPVPPTWVGPGGLAGGAGGAYPPGTVRNFLPINFPLFFRGR